MFFKQALYFVILFSLFITSEQAKSDSDEEFTWRVELEIALVSDPTELVGIKQKDFEDYIQPSLNLALYYKGFFVQSDRNGLGTRNRGSEIGYHFYVSDSHEISIVSKSYVAGFDENDLYADFFDEEIVPELAGIDPRLSSTMVGFRYTYFSPNSLLSVDLASGIDKDEHQGWILDAYYARTFELKNWDLNAGIGATYLSDQTNDYFYGVSNKESTSFRPEYSTDEGVIYTMEISAQYPLSSSWIFNTGVGVNHYSDSISDSPLVARDTVARFKMGFGYVF